MARLVTVEDYRVEIARVEKAIEKTTSKYIKRDYGKYLKRLRNELAKGVKQ